MYPPFLSALERPLAMRHREVFWDLPDMLGMIGGFQGLLFFFCGRVVGHLHVSLANLIWERTLVFVQDSVHVLRWLCVSIHARLSMAQAWELQQVYGEEVRKESNVCGGRSRFFVCLDINDVSHCGHI
jgi:hypothetical protein